PVNDSVELCPVTGRQAHRAWLERNKNGAAAQVDRPEHPGTLADAVHFGVGTRIGVAPDRIGGRQDDLAGPHQYTADRQLACLNRRAGVLNGKLHERFVGHEPPSEDYLSEQPQAEVPVKTSALASASG